MRFKAKAFFSIAMSRLERKNAENPPIFEGIKAKELNLVFSKTCLNARPKFRSSYSGRSLASATLGQRSQICGNNFRSEAPDGRIEARLHFSNEMSDLAGKKALFLTKLEGIEAKPPKCRQFSLITHRKSKILKKLTFKEHRMAGVGTVAVSSPRIQGVALA
jgi:hypothetical protein